MSTAVTLVVVERAFEAQVAFADIQAKEHAGKWCLDQHGVRFLRTFFALDRKRMICLYEAPDAEAVRIAQRTIAMPVERVWPAVATKPPNELTPTPIVVEREVPFVATVEQVEQMEQQSRWCFEAHRVAQLQSYLSMGGHRTLCVFSAPDAESVRVANREASLPVKSVWPAQLYP